jgi:hypothetical protein
MPRTLYKFIFPDIESTSSFGGTRPQRDNVRQPRREWKLSGRWKRNLLKVGISNSMGVVVLYIGIFEEADLRYKAT